MTTDVYDFIVSDETLAEHLAEMLARPEWHRHAACRGMGPTLFVPTDRVKSNLAKAICASCPVRVECLAFAEEGNEVGTWGGQSTTDRSRSGSTAA